MTKLHNGLSHNGTMTQTACNASICQPITGN